MEFSGGRQRSNSAPARLVTVPDRPVRLGLSGWIEKAIVEYRFTESQTSKLAAPFTGGFGGFPSVIDAAAEFDRDRRRSRMDASIRKFIESMRFSERAAFQLFLVRLIQELDRLSPTPIPDIDPAIRAALPPSIDRLNEMVRYAATNVTFFPTVPPTTLANLIRNRAFAANSDPSTAESAGESISMVDKNLTRIQMETMANGVFATRAGVCTSFAAAATSLLDKDRNIGSDRGYRLEYIGGKDHNICLVGRENTSSETEGEVPEPNLWSAGTIIVDPWAGAMGHGHVFYKWTPGLGGENGYPGILKNAFRGRTLVKYFDSQQG